MKTISPKKRKCFPGSLILFGLSLLWWNFGYPTLSKFPSSDLQLTILHRSREISKSKSDSAVHKNWELFNHPTLYKYLTIFDDGSHLFTLNGSTLLTMFYNELSVMELVHNFDEYMYSVEFLDTHPFLYNQWQMRSAGLINDTYSNVTANEEAETFGFPAFKSDQQTFEEASDRPFYGALNMYRNSAGASIDTGWYEMNCKAGFHFGMFCDRVLQDINMIAVPPYIHHFIDPYISFQNPNPNVNHTGDDYKYYNLARLLIRSLSNQTYLDTAEPLQLSMLENILGYFELNPVTRLELPTSVKFVIVIFDKVWGTKKAEMV
ncbi:spermatogenesis-associated protein 17 [Globomyces sp. JEL0801]|nr:spermatogenesis-associated protein 17 [Globomyces sp. JEL0801]